MLFHSWIRNLRLALVCQTRIKSRSRRFRQTVETLELRVLPASIVVPTVTAINLSGPSPTNGNSESWTASFSAPVTGVDPTDFALTETGSLSASLVQVAGSGSVYTVTVSGITGNGTLGLNLADNDSIINAASVPLGGIGVNNGNFSGQVATLDHVFPTVQSINRTNPAVATTDASVVSFTATFSEPVTGVTSSAFTLMKTGTINTVSTQVTPVSSSVYTVTVSGITGIGTLGLNLVDAGQIRDLAGNPLSSAVAVASFADQTIVRTGSGPRAVVAGDLNGDGKPDLVVPNVFDNYVSVLLGNGDGTFQSEKYVATGTRPYSVAIGDLNGDGKPDLLVTNSFDANVGVLLGNGDGTFASMQTFAVGTRPHSAVIGDVNGDGKADLLVANYFSSTVSVLLGNGDGTFQNQQTYGTFAYPTSITLGDLNADGKPDLVLANVGSNNVSLFLGNGDGTFQDQRVISTGTTPISVAIADLNGDGKPDLAVANYNSPSLGVLLGNGDGTFQSMQSMATATHPFTVTVADLNGDGLPDLIASYRQTNQVGVLLGNGNGTFQTTATFATGRQPYSVAVADLNGDGRPDLAVANFSGSVGVGASTASILLANGNGNFTGQSYTIAALPNITSPTVAILTTTSVTLGGSVTNDGGNAITDRGIVYAFTSVNPNPQIGGPGVMQLPVGGTTGLFSVNANGLTNGAVYSFAAYATNGVGTAYTTPATAFGVNLPPVLSGIESTPLPYKSNDPAFPPLPISNTFAVTDPDSNNLTKLTVQITSGYQHDSNGQDVLDFTSKYGITGSFDPSSGTLTLNGTAYVGNYREALRSVTFSSSGTNVSSSNRTLTIIASDDGAPTPAVSLPVTRTVTVLTTNVPPTLSSVTATPLPYVLGSPPVPVAPSATIVDPDSINLAGATIQITGNYQAGLDLLTADTSGTGITRTFDAASGTLTLSGVAALSSYQAVLRSITYGTNSFTGSAAVRTLTFLLNDGIAGSTPVTRDVDVIPYNFPPVVSGIEASPLAYKANDPAFPPLPISNTVAVTDPDSNNLTKLTVQITSGYQHDANGQDVLAFTNIYGITGAFDASTGTLTLSGTAYVGAYREALRTVTFSSSGTNVNTVNRTLTIVATDDGSPNAGISLPAIRTVTVSTANVPPTLSGVPMTSLSYVQGSTAISVAPTASISDPDSINLSSATIQITGNYQNGQDLLAATSVTGITGVFNPATGTLTLSGIASLAKYQMVLRTVTYSTSSTTGSTAPRTLTFLLNDGIASSTPVSRDVNVTPFNFPPVVSGIEASPLTYRANDSASPPVPISSTVAITDPDSNNLTHVTVQITAGYQHDGQGQDLLAFTSRFGISGAFDASTGTLTLSGTAYVGAYREALRTVTFSTSGMNVSTADRTLTIIATDDGSPNAGVSLPVTRNVTVTAAAFNFPPVVSGIESSPLAYTANQSAVPISSTVAITDPDSNNLTKLTVQITAGYQNDVNGTDVLAFASQFGITGSFDASTGTLTLSGTAYIGYYREALRTVTFRSAGTNVSTANRTLTIIATDDGSPSTAVSVPVVRTVTVAP